MPRPKPKDLPIYSTGEVMTGQKSVSRRLEQDRMAGIRFAGEFYRDTEDYDPVLKSHCRL